MDFAPYWAKGTHKGFCCWRWSHRSLDEALALANQAAQKLADRFRSGDIPKHGYGYPDRPFREPVIREIKNQTGDLVAVVTRNSYGSLVLNTARIMFVDVDLPEPKRPGGFLRKLFGKPEIGPAPGVEVAQPQLSGAIKTRPRPFHGCAPRTTTFMAVKTATFIFPFSAEVCMRRKSLGVVKHVSAQGYTCTGSEQSLQAVCRRHAAPKKFKSGCIPVLP